MSDAPLQTENDATLRAEFRSEVVRARALLASVIGDYESARGQVSWQEHARSLRSILVEFPDVESVDDVLPTSPVSTGDAR